MIQASLEKLDGVTRSGNPIDRFHLHPRVHEVAGQLLKDGHYRLAILQTYIALIDAVQTKAERSDLDGARLMQQVFSPGSPTLQCSDNKDEQQGFMMLFAGAAMAIRNPRAHKLEDVNDQDINQTLEWLAFASALFRVLDRAESTAGYSVLQ